MEQVADWVALAALFVGSFLCLTAAVGLGRFRDFFSRVHAAAKPQTLGVLLVLLAVGLRLPSWIDLGMLLLVGVFQMITVPTSGHMTGRGYYALARSDKADEGEVSGQGG
ncbi:monovalent cation/H(+) antiporter subunit G [Dermatophilus congolensis]|nr:monovalent cation/H(+) antiporter subunit G [Dermatophilus congolensis]MBO3132118.1 monovalent cation/H(+) antiporter subunit G [Dermatophilus congolensis]MBO3133726.1 monovalent cation/H(+) antiporter subunit G [Dermatophilus congolensis]MBO3135957.1 monovalent cation/H(+) antiporter subunit G [Dermatophilus congolensis]MBO3138199.1 monovalent cation/H(+) antiporter subunit G [Dermatophilus congolensis]